MRKFAFFLSLVVVLSLVLAACSGSKSNNQGTQTVPTSGATELPNTGLTGTETTGGSTTTETTGLTGTETTGGLTATETPMALETSTPSVSTTLAPATTQTTGGFVTGTQTVALPPIGMADPSRLTTLMTFDVRNANGDVLGDVNNMIIDLGTQRILYVLVGSGGFLGIGEKQIPVPYEQLQINPACIAAISSTSTNGTSSTGGTTSSSTGSSTDMSGTVAATSTEMAGTGTSGTGTTGSAASTETAGTTGTGASTQAGMDKCYFLMNVDQNVLKNAPNFDRNQMPDINTPSWDAQFKQYWQQNGSASASSTGSASVTETPSASTSSSSTSSAGSAAATETPGASTSGTGSSTGTTGANSQANNRLILADELLGSQVVAGMASSSSSTGGTSSTSSSSTSGTGSATTTETAVTGTSGTGSATSTETAGTGSSSTGSTSGSTVAAGETIGTITDAIVELQSGVIRYYLVTAEAAMGSTLNGRLVPIPPQAFTFAAGGSSSNQRTATLNVNNMTLSQAPAFDEGTFPNASIQGWDTGLRNFWSSQNFNSMMNP